MTTPEIRSYPFPIASSVEVKLPRVVELLGIEHRPEAKVRSSTLFLVALVEPGTDETVHRFRLGCEGVALPPGYAPRPLGNCRVEKPKPTTYWLFGMLPDP